MWKTYRGNQALMYYCQINCELHCARSNGENEKKKKKKKKIYI